MCRSSRKPRPFGPDLRHAKIPSDWLEHYFTGGYIEKVEVSRAQKTWTFYLCLPRPLPPDILEGLEQRIGRAFPPCGTSSF